MAVKAGNEKGKVYLGNRKAKRAYLGKAKVYSAGNICTYHVDGSTYQEEVDEGGSVLSPASFVPQKDGWEFLGWRDTQTAGDALTEKVMGDEPVDLYAMFKHPDKFIGLRNVEWSNPSWPSDKTVYSDLDFGKYASFNCTNGYLHLKANFAAGRLYMLVRGSDGASSIWSERSYGGNEIATNIKGKSMAFGQKSGVG